jgi:flagellar biosynthesis/type III secretory pathway chaperone
MDNMTFNWELITDHVENVKHALSQDKFQTMRELLVSIDHLLNALTALQEDPMTTTHAHNAHTDKFKTQPTWTDVPWEPVMLQIKSNLVLTHKTVEDVRHANGHNSCQILPRLNALPDHLLFATVEKRYLPMDTHVMLVQQDQSKAWLTTNNVSDQTVEDNMRSNSQLILTTVEDVRLANGHNSLLTHQRPNVSQDHWLIATALVEETV